MTTDQSCRLPCTASGQGKVNVGCKAGTEQGALPPKTAEDFIEMLPVKNVYKNDKHIICIAYRHPTFPSDDQTNVSMQVVCDDVRLIEHCVQGQFCQKPDQTS